MRRRSGGSSSRQRWWWLPVAALVLASAPVLGAGLYPGAMCHGTGNGYYDDLYYYRARAENGSDSTIGVYCSVYREDIDDSPAGWIYLLDQNPSANASCTLRCRSSSSSSQSYSSTLNSSGSSATPVKYTFSNPPTCSTDDSVYIYCTIPARYGSARSGVVSYYVYD